jgi:hypothetical protein
MDGCSAAITLDPELTEPSSVSRQDEIDGF